MAIYIYTHVSIYLSIYLSFFLSFLFALFLVPAVKANRTYCVSTLPQLTKCGCLFLLYEKTTDPYAAWTAKE